MTSTGRDGGARSYSLFHNVLLDDRICPRLRMRTITLKHSPCHATSTKPNIDYCLPNFSVILDLEPGVPLCFVTLPYFKKNKMKRHFV